MKHGLLSFIFFVLNCSNFAPNTIVSTGLSWADSTYSHELRIRDGESGRETVINQSNVERFNFYLIDSGFNYCDTGPSFCDAGTGLCASNSKSSLCFTGAIEEICLLLKELSKNAEEAYASGGHDRTELVSCSQSTYDESINITYNVSTDYDCGEHSIFRWIPTCPFTSSSGLDRPLR